MIVLFIVGFTIFLFGLFLLAAMCAAAAEEDKEMEKEKQRYIKELKHRQKFLKELKNDIKKKEAK